MGREEVSRSKKKARTTTERPQETYYLEPRAGQKRVRKYPLQGRESPPPEPEEDPNLIDLIIKEPKERHGEERRLHEYFHDGGGPEARAVYPYSQPRQARDKRFWSHFHADWYRSVYLPKDGPTNAMQWIDFAKMEKKKSAVFTEVIEACKHHGIYNIMAFEKPWNQEVILQFYSTVYFDQENDKMEWMTNGKRYTITLDRFATLLKLKSHRSRPKKIHSRAVLKDNELDFMYQPGTEFRPGQVRNLLPFFTVLHRMARMTLAPRGGDASWIPNYERNLLLAIRDNTKFDAFDFIQGND